MQERCEVNSVCWNEGRVQSVVVVGCVSVCVCLPSARVSSHIPECKKRKKGGVWIAAVTAAKSLPGLLLACITSEL